MKKQNLGIAVVGSGRIGSLRSKLIRNHPSVDFIAVSDLNLSQAKKLGNTINADFVSDNNMEIISHPEVDAVIVSTSEHQHLEPVLQSISKKKPVLLEKPIALTLADADEIIQNSENQNVEVLVGYAQRFKRRYFVAKEQIQKGRLGQIIGANGRACNNRSQGLEILKRSPEATPVIDVLTYWVDMICWFMSDQRPVEVVARGNSVVYKEAGHESVDDITWAIITFEDGAIVNLGICYALPSKYPSQGSGVRIEIFGTDGVLMLDGDQKEELIHTEKGIPHLYIPDHNVNTTFLSTTAPGDWALGEFWGPLNDETRAWVDHIATDSPCHIATTREARKTLEITLAIQESSRTGKTVSIPIS